MVLVGHSSQQAAAVMVSGICITFCVFVYSEASQPMEYSLEGYTLCTCRDEGSGSVSPSCMQYCTVRITFMRLLKM